MQATLKRGDLLYVITPTGHGYMAVAIVFDFTDEVIASRWGLPGVSLGTRAEVAASRLITVYPCDRGQNLDRLDRDLLDQWQRVAGAGEPRALGESDSAFRARLCGSASSGDGPVRCVQCEAIYTYVQVPPGGYICYSCRVEM